jgi:hypothetical protein
MMVRSIHTAWLNKDNYYDEPVFGTAENYKKIAYYYSRFKRARHTSFIQSSNPGEAAM